MTDIVERLRILPDADPRSNRERLEAADEIEQLRSVLKKIADLHRGPGSALAQSALDTMRLLESKP